MPVVSLALLAASPAPACSGSPTEPTGTHGPDGAGGEAGESGTRCGPGEEARGTTVQLIHASQSGASNLAYTDGTVIDSFDITVTLDTTAPTATGGAASADGRSVTITFDEAMDTARKPAVSAFTVEADGAELDVDSDYFYESTILTLTLDSSVTPQIRYYHNVTVSYTQPSSGDRLQDAIDVVLVVVVYESKDDDACWCCGRRLRRARGPHRPGGFAMR